MCFHLFNISTIGRGSYGSACCGTSTTFAGGASHGGSGASPKTGVTLNGPAYGSYLFPILPGSSGSNTNSQGGLGKIFMFLLLF